MKTRPLRHRSGRMRLPLIAGALTLVVAACAGNDTTADVVAPDPAPTTAATPPTVTQPPAATDVDLQIYTSSGDRSGNRFFDGRADLSAPPLDVVLAATPAWIVAAPVADRIVWVVADVDGNLSAFAESGGQIADFPLGETTLPPGAPPTVIVGGSAVSIFQPSGAAPLAGHSLVAGSPIVIASDGTVFAGADPVPNVTALTDGRIVVSRRGEAAFLAEPTERLTHGVLGDRVEAETVIVLAPGSASVQAVLDAPGDTVFEAVSPMWADVTGDGVDEVVVTASSGAAGAAMTVYSATGELIAAAEPIGTGNRWLNQLAVVPAGTGDPIEVVEVRTPHIGGIVRWYQLEGAALELQTDAERYSSHRIGSRNLDQGVALDADGNGQPDVLVPSQDQETLVALTRTPDGSEIVLTAALGAALATNIAAAERPDGSTSVAVGTVDGRLLVWP